MPRPEHPLIVLAVETLARELRFDPSVLWDLVDGKPVPPWISDAIAGLTKRHTHSTFPEVDATSNSLRSVAKFNEDNLQHPAVKRLSRLRVSMAEVSRVLTERLGRPVPMSTVRSWYKDPERKDARGIPADAAAVLRDEYQIPFTAWHRVIKSV